MQHGLWSRAVWAPKLVALAMLLGACGGRGDPANMSSDASDSMGALDASAGDLVFGGHHDGIIGERNRAQTNGEVCDPGDQQSCVIAGSK